MRWTRGGLVACGLGLALLVIACGPQGPTPEELAQEEEWAWLGETKQQLDSMRAELAELKEQLALADVEEEEGEAEAEGEAAAEEGMTVEEMQARFSELEEQVADTADEFGQRLVDYINANPMIQGEEPTERQLAAIRLKSGEDIALAREYIAKGGDYRRAIEIYRTSLMVDPDNEDLKAALAEAEADRFMTEERFAVVKKGMTDEQVRELLGQVNLHNIRDYPDKNVKAWFYPAGEGGAAAGIYFEQDKRTGEWTVYQAKFEAVKPRSEEEG